MKNYWLAMGKPTQASGVWENNVPQPGVAALGDDASTRRFRLNIADATDVPTIWGFQLFAE